MNTIELRNMSLSITKQVTSTKDVITITMSS